LKRLLFRHKAGHEGKKTLGEEGGGEENDVVVFVRRQGGGRDRRGTVRREEGFPGA